MIKVNVKVKGQTYDINIPETLKEIDVNYLVDLASEVNVADNYSLIAIISRARLDETLLAVSKRKESMVGVIPMFIKCGKTQIDYINNIAPGNILVIGAGAIENSHHLNIPANNLAKDKMIGMIMQDETNSNAKSSKAFMDNMTNSKTACFVSFKLVPNCDIVGNYCDNINHDTTLNNYVVKKALLS